MATRIPTLFGFAFARLQGGLNNFAPDGAGLLLSRENSLTRPGCANIPGSFDYAPFTHFSTGFPRRSAQDDKFDNAILARVNSCPDTCLAYGYRPGQGHAIPRPNRIAALFSASFTVRPRSLLRGLTGRGIVMALESSGAGPSPVRLTKARRRGFGMAYRWGWDLVRDGRSLGGDGRVIGH